MKTKDNLIDFLNEEKHYKDEKAFLDKLIALNTIGFLFATFGFFICLVFLLFV